jgi:uncharacterized membrane protein YhhN
MNPGDGWQARTAGSLAIPHIGQQIRRELVVALTREPHMRIAFNISGVLFLLAGCVWILQGINVLPGSFMTGQTKWAVYGAILAAVGIGLLISANRRRV